MKDYLQFLDVCVVGEEYYFSYLKFNGLFKGNVNSSTAEFVGTFPDESKNQVFLHRRVVNIEESLFFIPYRGRGISEYNIREKKYTFYRVMCKGNIVSYSQAHLIGKDILLVPVNDEADFAIFHYAERNIEYLPKLWENIKRVISGEVLFDVFSSVYCTNKLIITVWNSNVVLEIDMESFDVTVHKIGKDYCFRNISNIDGRYWLTQLRTDVIVSFSDAFTDIKEYECKETDDVEYSSFRVIKAGNSIVAIPADSGTLWKFNDTKGCFEKISLEFPKDCWDLAIQGLYFTGSLVNSDNELVLLPKKCKFLLVISKDVHSVTPYKIEVENYEEIRNRVVSECIEDEISDKGILQEGSAEMIDLSGFVSFIKGHNFGQ